MDAARATGKRLGHPPATTPEQVRHARLLGVSSSTLYKHVPKLSVARVLPEQIALLHKHWASPGPAQVD
ncbi:hypothetical protein GCM10007079_20990 [Nocardiopsis terrae]|uniref:Uncharacterized protein n=1 Tax=Nocardiopsis terrae TaxID=372655 RepID=A0ABR9HGY6_9ACTN|nr:hypothetical protein [Nocardiopsis terrae]GHC81302.1 hypothetical protein GCM10007079_20990 [Nocardiopsis terrae]